MHSNRWYGELPSILVTAPSNCAIDEVATRVLKEGLINGDGVTEYPRIVRIGETSNELVARYKLYEIVERIFDGSKDSNLSEFSKLQQLKRDPKSTPDQINYEKGRIFEMITNNVLGDKKKYPIIFSTLAGCGSPNIAKRSFDIIIIDEAAQATVPSSSIPFQLSNKIILAGDPEQLPPTVISSEAKKMGYEMSLMERLKRGGFPIAKFDTQYRCHPMIYDFPSKAFYDGQIKNGKNVMDYQQRFYSDRDHRFGPITFYDMVDGISTKEGTKSNSNFEETLQTFLACCGWGFFEIF